ncbi:hypothetical protein OAO18_06330 [Francisellaceae bacterium]|nr:hypothetical protein [Francisellaceae bacterium]
MKIIVPYQYDISGSDNQYSFTFSYSDLTFTDEKSEASNIHSYFLKPEKYYDSVIYESYGKESSENLAYCSDVTQTNCNPVYLDTLYHQDEIFGYSEFSVKVEDAFIYAFKQPNSGARLKCSNSSQNNHGRTKGNLNNIPGYNTNSVCFRNESNSFELGDDFYTYSLVLDGDPRGTNINSPQDSHYFQVLTKDGDSFVIENTFPKIAKGSLDPKMTYQTTVLKCFDGDNNCTVTDSGLIVDNEIVSRQLISGSEVTSHKDALNKTFYTTDQPYVFTKSPSATYLFAPIQPDYDEWENKQSMLEIPSGTMTGTVDTIFALNLSFMPSTTQLKNSSIIMVSANGSYRLIYTGDGSNTGDPKKQGQPYSIIVQKKDGNGWSFYYDAYGYDEKPSSETSPGESKSSPDIAGLTFINGNLTTYEYDPNYLSDNNANKLKEINSVANEYKLHGYQWTPDPYAKLILQDDGNLVIYSSNVSSLTDNQLGIPVTHGQALWAANWRKDVEEGDNVWNKIQNPKLPPSSGEATSVKE